MRPEETIDFHLRWVWAKVSRLYNAEAARHDSSMAIGYILLNIDREGTPSTKLGPKMGMEPRSLTRTLKTMEENGLIVRKADQEDRRMVRVHLTKKGQAMRDASRDAVLRFNNFVRDHLDAAKLAVFFDVMSDLNALLDDPQLFELPPKKSSLPA
jgi:DNA-binding MarR family transcriptional regulator